MPATVPEGKWILVVGLEPSTNLARAEELQKQLVDGGIAEAGVLESKDYGDLEIGTVPVQTTQPVVIYVGVEDDPADLVDCEDVQKVELKEGFGLLPACIPAQPDP